MLSTSLVFVVRFAVNVKHPTNGSFPLVRLTSEKKKSGVSSDTQRKKKRAIRKREVQKCTKKRISLQIQKFQKKERKRGQKGGKKALAAKSCFV